MNGFSRDSEAATILPTPESRSGYQFPSATLPAPERDQFPLCRRPDRKAPLLLKGPWLSRRDPAVYPDKIAHCRAAGAPRPRAANDKTGQITDLPLEKPLWTRWSLPPAR